MLHRALLAIVLVVGVGLARRAQAYVLPAESLVRLYAEVRHTLGLRDATLALNADLLDHDHQVDERLYLKRPERARLVQQDEQVWVTVDREGQQASGEDKALKAVPGPSPNLLPILLMPRGKDADEMGARVLRALQGVGVDTKIVTLSRQAETLVYVLGAHAWEPEKAQVWIDKITFAPVRFKVPTQIADKTVMVETRLLEYGSGPVGNSLPRVFEEYHDGNLVRRAEVISVQHDQNLPETLFQWSSRR